MVAYMGSHLEILNQINKIMNPAYEPITKAEELNKIAQERRDQVIQAYIYIEDEEKILVQARESAALASVSSVISWRDFQFNSLIAEKKRIKAEKELEKLTILTTTNTSGIISRQKRSYDIAVAKQRANRADSKAIEAERNARVSNKIQEKEYNIALLTADDVIVVEQRVLQREKRANDLKLLADRALEAAIIERELEEDRIYREIQKNSKMCSWFKIW